MDLTCLDDILEDDSKVLGEIYMMTNTKNNMQYVGQTWTHRLNHGKYRPFGIIGRFKDHVSEALCNNKAKQCKYLNNAIRKNGANSFKVELLERCQRHILDEREIHYINHLNTLYPNGYNLTKGGKTLWKANYEDEVIDNQYKQQPRNQQRTEGTKKLISKRLKEAFEREPQLKQQRMQQAQKQHMEAKLKKYENVVFDEYLEQYLHPVVSKKTNSIKFYKVIINGITTRFYGKHVAPEELKENAMKFLQTIQTKSLATLPNCSGKP